MGLLPPRVEGLEPVCGNGWLYSYSSAHALLSSLAKTLV